MALVREELAIYSDFCASSISKTAVEITGAIGGDANRRWLGYPLLFVSVVSLHAVCLKAATSS
ncbi:MAG: hypothetical protein RR701_18925, partial [Comamonas sp.]